MRPFRPPRRARDRLLSVYHISDVPCTLARPSHQLATATADEQAPQGRAPSDLLDVVSTTSASVSVRAALGRMLLHRLVTQPGEKVGLGAWSQVLKLESDFAETWCGLGQRPGVRGHRESTWSRGADAARLNIQDLIPIGEVVAVAIVNADTLPFGFQFGRVVR